MTTIVYKDGILASDTLITCNNSRIGHLTKIAKNKGIIAAAAGSAEFVANFLKWFKTGDWKNPHFPDDDDKLSIGLIISKHGELDLYESTGSLTIRSDTYAEGSGADFAVGAMKAGASAIEAVRIAIECDVFSGGEIEHVKLGKGR